MSLNDTRSWGTFSVQFLLPATLKAPVFSPLPSRQRFGVPDSSLQFSAVVPHNGAENEPNMSPVVT